jgi:hypothetical protein
VFQLWVNFGFYNGMPMTPEMKALRQFYVRLLKTCRETEAIRKGGLYDLQAFNVQNRTAGYDGRHIYSYLRFSGDSRVLVVVNFDTQAKEANIRIPANAFAAMGLGANGTYRLRNLLQEGSRTIDFDAAQVVDSGNATSGIPVSLPPLSAYVFALK